MLDRIAQFIARHRMFEPGQRVGVAVSGGADSVFLLYALRELAPRWDLQLSVIHIEHGIRGVESLADAEVLGAMRTLGFYSHVEGAVRERAERAGFDLVVPRSRMAREGSDLVAGLL